MAQCVYCEKTDTLNTQLTVTLEDGSRVTVDICDDHAEDATVKTARAAYLAKQDKIAEVIAQAEALGLKLGPTTQSGIATVERQVPLPQERQPTQPTQPTPQPIIEDLDNEDDVVSTSVIDSRPGMMSVGGQTELGAVASHGSHEVSGKRDVLPQEAREGKAKMALVEGRGGQPIAIAEKRVDGTGTTRVKVTNKENDQKLQSRFKRMAQDSIDDKVPDFARSGYKNTTVSCPFCRGQGSVNQGTKIIECPKCEGAGFISTY